MSLLSNKDFETVTKNPAQKAGFSISENSLSTDCRNERSLVATTAASAFVTAATATTA